MTSTEQINGHRLGGVSDEPAHPSFPVQSSENTTKRSAAAQGSVSTQLEAEAVELRRIQRIEQDNADVFATVRDQDERANDKKVDRKIRAAQRKARLQLGLVNAQKEARLARQTSELDRIEDQERIDQRKALRKRNALTNPNAALSSAYRRWRHYSWALAAISVVGIAFTSWAVAHGLGGQSPDPLLYAVDPMFCVPLLVIVLVQSFAAQHGRLSLVAPTRTSTNGRGEEVRRMTAIGWIEAGLLCGSMGMAAFGAIRLGDFGSPMFAAMVLAPLLLVISISLQYVIAKLFGSIIAEINLDGAADEETTRKAAVTANLLVPHVRDLIERGELPLQNDGVPSANQIRAAINRSKLVASVIRDVLVEEQQKGGE